MRRYGQSREEIEGSAAETIRAQSNTDQELLDFLSSGTAEVSGQHVRKYANKTDSKETDATEDEDLRGGYPSDLGLNEETGESYLQDANVYMGKVSAGEVREASVVGRAGSDTVGEVSQEKVSYHLEGDQKTKASDSETAAPAAISWPRIKDHSGASLGRDVYPEGSWMSHTNRSTSTLYGTPVGPFIHPKDIANHPESTDVPNILRGLMRTLAHPVVIVTTADPSQYNSKAYKDGKPPLTTKPSEETRPKYQKNHFHGATISSLTTLSLTGAEFPIVSFNLQHPSSTLQGVLGQRHFLIHLCRSNRRGAEIADTFARFRGNPFLTLKELKFSVKHVVQELPDGNQVVMPQLVKDHAFHGILRCELIGDEPDQGWAQVADHTVVFAKVNEIFTPRELYKDIQNLSYSGGAYNISKSGLGLPTQTLAQPMDLPGYPKEHVSTHENDVDGDAKKTSLVPPPSPYIRRVRSDVATYIENSLDRTGRKS